MSVFSKIKRGREAAKEHNAKQAEKEQQEAVKPPYRHVPTHAAIDAMAAGPASSRESDRPKILEQNRRRSTLTASGVGMSGMMTPMVATPGSMSPGSSTPVPAMPRNNSALSQVSYPSTHVAIPVVPLPRAYSHGNMNTPWTHQSAEAAFAPMEQSTSASIKGKEVERPIVLGLGRDSRSSKVNSLDSSGDSSSSQDELEMRSLQQQQEQHQSNRTGASRMPITNGQPDYFHRLHPGHSRRASGTSSPTFYPPQARSSQSAQKTVTPRPVGNVVIPSEGIPPVPSLPPLQLGGAMSGSAMSSSTASVASSNTLAGNAVSAPHHYHQKVAFIMRGQEPVADSDVFTSDGSEQEPYAIGAAITSPGNYDANTTPSAGKKGKRASKSARFADLETIDSHVSYPSEFEPRMAGVQLPSTFVDQQSLPKPAQLPANNGKLSKSTSGSPPKGPKKNRWSLRGSKTPVVAV